MSGTERERAWLELLAQREAIVFMLRFTAMLVVLAAGAAMAQSRAERMPMNSLMVIMPYKCEGMWVFDDPAVGLNKEPFIAGIDTLIDKATANIPDSEHGFRAIFSAAPFPGANFVLQWRREESGGNWYYSPQFQQEGWVCPALFNYFQTAPPQIYVKVEPREQAVTR